MVWGIITLLLSALSFIMFSQPVFAIYGNDKLVELGDLLGLTKKNCYNVIEFKDGQNDFLIAGNVFLILSMVCCGLLIIFTMLNIIARTTKIKCNVGTKIIALLFFIFTLIAAIMFIIYCDKDNSISNVIDGIKNGKTVLSIGYGLIVSLVASFLALIFSPRKKK